MPVGFVQLDNMQLVWFDSHLNLTKRFSIAFNALNVKMIIPSVEYKPTHYGFTRPDWICAGWTKEMLKKHIKYGNAIVANKEEILDLKPDAVVITSFEQQFEVIHELMPKLPKSTKLIFHSGNCYFPPTEYPHYLIRNLLYSDAVSHENTRKHQYVNSLYYRPYTPFDVYTYTPHTENIPIVGNGTNNFEKDWPEGFGFSKACEKHIPEAKFEYTSNKIEQEVIESIKRSICSTSFKVSEGCGFFGIESAAIGRPVFLLRQYNQHKSYLQWLVEGETAFYVSSIQEFRAKLKALIDSPDYRNWVHWNCAQKIREYINNEDQIERLGKFLENLQ